MATALNFMLLALLNVAAGRSIVGGKLLEFSRSQRQVYGRYASKDGVHGITFFSGPDDYLLIRSFGGVKIVDTSPFTEADGKKLRSVYIMGYEYIQHSSPAHSDNPVDHDTSLSHVLQGLPGMREITLLKEAAEALGERGINGKNTPAAMPFFMFTLRITQLYTKGPYSNTTATTLTDRHKRQSCFNSCPPCPDDECYGQCGLGCTCWSFLCGDCCFHLGCYDHDTCCREEYFQIRCLLPFGFNCDTHYSC